MKNKNRISRLISLASGPERVIATFGNARLVFAPCGSVELRGGHRADQTTAKEWISLFMHEAVPRFVE